MTGLLLMKVARIVKGEKVGINIRAKGQNGEREVQQALEEIVLSVMRKLEMELPVKAVIQRNQNQSAVGGSDLTGTFGLAIEVKRQEQLSINTWWKQCLKSAEESGEHPVLLYRQNGKKWKCVTLMWLSLPGNKQVQVRAEMDWDSFLNWFREWANESLLKI